jgi:RNA recognition motif-containing protein
MQEELSLRDKTVFIQNLPPNCTEQEIINALRLCGDVSVSVLIVLYAELLGICYER